MGVVESFAALIPTSTSYIDLFLRVVFPLERKIVQIPSGPISIVTKFMPSIRSISSAIITDYIS